MQAYAECFASPENLERLLESAEKRDSLNVYAVNSRGDQRQLGGSGNPGATALTWGVFPDREILQPTVFDPETFMGVWAEEAFSLWTTMWLNLYEEDSVSYELIESISSEFFLIAIVDNDFQKNDSLWKCLLSVTNQDFIKE